MKHILLLASSFITHTTTQSQTPQNPVTKFSRHHQIIDFFKALEKNNPTKIKLENYGKTYEGRDLMLAFISSEENIKKLEQIKQQKKLYMFLQNFFFGLV